MTLKILVTGATGNVGRAVVDCLVEMGAPVRAAVRPSELAHTPNLPAGVEITPFDLGDPTTFVPALAGVDRLFLMRPPAITDIEHTIKPFVETAARMGVRHITFLSLIGAESNRLVPHRAVEDLLIAGDVPYTLLRAGFFMQNLDTTHRAEIRDENEIFIPAGHGRTAFIDVRDIAAVAAKTLTEPGHDNVAYPLTGEESLTYDEVADVLTASLGRPITYTHPNALRFAWRHWRKGQPLSYVGVMTMIYLTTRWGMAAKMTADVRRLLGRAPRTLREYVADYAAVWQKTTA
ncbi:MAG: SDR family oxidoreductase [Chloroflexi bacterium]|nr:SDR family oxidoreductase [Chloroflexota bacterium]